MIAASGDTSGVTDTHALQALMDANAGGIVRLSGTPSTPFHLNGPLVIPHAGITVRGAGGSNGITPVIKQASGVNMRPPGLAAGHLAGVWSSAATYRRGDLVLMPVSGESGGYPEAESRGAFARGVAYAVNDVVLSSADSGVYLCTAAIGMSSVTPDRDCFGATTPFHWIRLATELWQCTADGTRGTPPLQESPTWFAVPRIGLFTSSAYLSETGYGDEPFQISSLALDGNRAENPHSSACGVLAVAFWSELSDNYVHDMPGDGIVLADRTVSGAPISQTGSMWRVRQNFLSDISGHGLYQQSSAGNNLDGWCQDNAVQNCGKSALRWANSAGWYVRDNHVFGVGWGAIECGAMFATQVRGNYIESFGDQGAARAWYAGIDGRVQSGAPSYVKDNIIRCNEPQWNDVAGFQYIALTAANAPGHPGTVYLDGNDMGPWEGVTASTVGTGLVLQSPELGNEMTVVTGTNLSAGAHAETYWGAVDGAKLNVLAAAPQQSGTTTLRGGRSEHVASRAVSASTVIRLTHQVAAGVPGVLTASVIPWQGFTIHSTSRTDESSVFWEVLRY
jgi:hypothetical protein